MPLFWKCSLYLLENWPLIETTLFLMIGNAKCVSDMVDRRVCYMVLGWLVTMKCRMHNSICKKKSVQYILTIRIRAKIRIILSFKCSFLLNHWVVVLCSYSLWMYECMFVTNTRQAINFCLYSMCKAVWRIHRGHVLDKVKERSFVLVPLWQICHYGGIQQSTRVKCIIQIEGESQQKMLGEEEAINCIQHVLQG